MSKIHQKLHLIQQNCHVPKGNFNSFGNYSYRSCEDILEILKPYLVEQKVTLTLSDEITSIGDRFYVKSTALLTDSESGESVSACAFSREPDTQKNFLEPQITGCASSYARKYCISGLFCLDGNRDIDGIESSKTPTDNFSDTLPSSNDIISNGADDAKCEVCDIPIVNQKVLKYSQQKFGRTLCYNCQRELNKTSI